MNQSAKKVFSLVCLVTAFNLSNAQGGYIIVFGGSFENDSISAVAHKTNFSESLLIKVNSSTGISPKFLFIDSTHFGDSLTLSVKNKPLRVSIPIRPIRDFKFGYVWLMKGKLSYEEHDKPLMLE